MALIQSATHAAPARWPQEPALGAPRSGELRMLPSQSALRLSRCPSPRHSDADQARSHGLLLLTSMAGSASLVCYRAWRRGEGRSPRRCCWRTRLAATTDAQDACAGRREAVSSVAAGLLGSSTGAIGSTAGVKAAATAVPPPLQLPTMGAGCWAWGDKLFWGYDEREDRELKEAFMTLTQGGVRFFDTAEIYGAGRSEKLLGQFIDAAGGNVQVATKFAPVPFKTSRSDVIASCKESLGRLKLKKIDLYQIHFPAVWKNEEFWDGLGDCYEQGLVKAVGVSNYGRAAVREIHGVLAQRGIPLTSNQVQYSLLYRYPELNGMKETCDELGVRILAYSPLGTGLLTGKYSEDKPEAMPSGGRRFLVEEMLKAPGYKELIATMRDVGARNGSATPSQVALGWLIAKGVTPIPGVRTIKQAQDNLGALQVSLSAADVATLDAAAAKTVSVLTPERSFMVKESADTKKVLFDA